MGLRAPLISERVIAGRTLSKRQVAELSNQHTAQIRDLMRQKHGLMTLLATIIRHPDALTRDAQGRVILERAAMDELKENTRVQSYPDGDRWVLKVFESTYVLQAEPLDLRITGTPTE